MMINTIPSSPEFEFWSVVRNPPHPEPPTRILSADELFSDGFLLPLDRLSLRSSTDDDDREGTGTGTEAPGSIRPHDAASPACTTPENVPSGPNLGAEPTGSTSKRWRDMFKKRPPSDHQQVEDVGCRDGKDKGYNNKRRKDKRNGGGSGGSPELNINIWPFSRSRSAGNGVSRPGYQLGGPPTRRVSSAPCSRSNSAGDSKSRTTNGSRWPNSPARAGIHLGRSSPVWQPRRAGSSTSASRVSTAVEPGISISIKNGRGQVRTNKKDNTEINSRIRVPNLPWIGSRGNLVCRSEPLGATGRADGGAGSLFRLRGLFTKKVN